MSDSALIHNGKATVIVGWDDAAHLSEDEKAELERSLPPHQREARKSGIPSLGAGAVYPVPVSEIRCDPFPIPAYWPKLYALDVGWKRTAALWMAWDRNVDVMYIYTEHYRGEADPSTHAMAIRARGEWIQGVIDPAARGRSQFDGQKLIEAYKNQGLKLVEAKNAVDAGIYEVWLRLSTGRLKVFSTCQHFFDEYRIYRRNEKGQIVKENDHCLHPSTMVHTRKGVKPISELVGTEGEVLTIGGKWASYRSCRMTAENEKIVRVKFDDGGEVLCTPDHKFLTPEGWIYAQDMVGGRCYNAVSQSNQSGELCQLKLSQKLYKNFTERVTTSVESIFSVMAFACTELFGRIRQGYVYHPAITYTIRMATRPTIGQTTLSLSVQQGTCLTTTKVCQSSSRKQHLKQQRSGTAVSKGRTGIISTTSTTPKNFTRRPSLIASSVAKVLRRKLMGKTSSAPTAASQQQGGRAALITWFASAQCAIQNLWLTSIQKRKRANVSVQPFCVSVEEAGRSDVYCLTVPETQSFAVQNGYVVHNCMDAMRYVVMGCEHAQVQPANKHRNAIGSASVSGAAGI